MSTEPLKINLTTATPDEISDVLLDINGSVLSAYCKHHDDSYERRLEVFILLLTGLLGFVAEEFSEEQSMLVALDLVKIISPETPPSQLH